MCAAYRVPLCFSSDSDCFVKYHHRNFQLEKETIEKGKQQHQAEATVLGRLTESVKDKGRPIGSVKHKARGKRKKN